MVKQDVVLEPINGNMLLGLSFLTPKSQLQSQHDMDFDHRIHWDIKILKSQSHTCRRRVAESLLINQKAHSQIVMIMLIFTDNDIYCILKKLRVTQGSKPSS